MKTANYDKAICWIIRHGRGGKTPRDVNVVAGWRIVNFAAALFDKSVREVAHDVVEFAKAINGEAEIDQ
jgi:hypothetical protein